MLTLSIISLFIGEVFAEDAAKSRALAEEAGAQFNDVDLQPFRDAVRPLTEEKLNSDVTKKIYNQMHAQGE